jgi:hypothetical protein
MAYHNLSAAWRAQFSQSDGSSAALCLQAHGVGNFRGPDVASIMLITLTVDGRNALPVFFSSCHRRLQHNFFACRLTLVALGSLVSSAALRPSTPLASIVICTVVIVVVNLAVNEGYARGWIPHDVLRSHPILLWVNGEVDLCSKGPYRDNLLCPLLLRCVMLSVMWQTPGCDSRLTVNRACTQPGQCPGPRAAQIVGKHSTMLQHLLPQPRACMFMTYCMGCWYAQFVQALLVISRPVSREFVLVTLPVQSPTVVQGICQMPESGSVQVASLRRTCSTAS